MATDCLFDKFKYILYAPQNATGLPLVVMLHGSDENGYLRNEIID